jgi:two-component system sensor kinase
MEAELEQYRRHLEDLVAERTAELSATNKELESFSYTISHDLRAPLRAIDGFSGILLEEYQDRIDSEGKRFLKIIRRNTQNMGQLIDDLLAFSRTGRQEIVKSRISLEKLARSVAEEIETSIAGREVHIDIGKLPDAYGDHSMLRQVFINLISNSVKFTRLRETANIEINSMTQGDEIVYFIKDNGAGFDMKYTDKLFGVFQRLHRADEFEGTGVGLAIVQRVIHRHGGRVWAESTPGEGTTFYFTLPVKDREDRR